MPGSGRALIQASVRALEPSCRVLRRITRGVGNIAQVEERLRKVRVDFQRIFVLGSRFPKISLILIEETQIMRQFGSWVNACGS
jgi:hypothetical protein